MILKTPDPRDADIHELENLKEHPNLSAETRTRIALEIRLIQAGLRGEREAAHEIDFHSGANENRMVIHDLRLEHQGRVAQIDHLIINRLLQVFVIETKHFREGLSINEHGEFTAWRNGKPKGISSPLAQNQRHADLLQQVMETLPLPTRLGVTLHPIMEPVVLISSQSRITRPKGFDTSRIIKADQFDQWLRQFIEGISPLKAARMVSADTIRDLGEQLVKLHTPLVRNWAARFGTDKAEPLTAASQPLEISTVDCELLSTSKLASRLGITTAALLQRLEAQGLIERREPRWYLTEEGKRAGGIFRMSKQFGPYFLWPTQLGELVMSQESATATPNPAST